MVSKKNVSKVILLFLLTSHTVNAGSLFSKVTTRGSGCPLGSTDVVKTEDQKTVSVLFTEMQATLPQLDGENENDEASADHRQTTSRFDSSIVHKLCNIEIEADVPEGEYIEEVELSADFRGATFKDHGTKALFSSNLIEVSGQTQHSHRIRNMLGRKVWRDGIVEEDWFIKGEKTIPVISNCQQQSRHKVKFVLQNILKAMINNRHDQNSNVFIGLDSADLAGVMKVKFKTSTCSSHNNGGVRPLPHGPSNGGGYSGNGPVRRRRDLDLPSRRCPRYMSYNPRTGRCQ